MYEHGFTFGKYYPLHSGHLALIRFARSHCKRLTVLVCASDSELIDGELRAQWLREEFSGHQAIRVEVMHYRETDLPNTSVSSRPVSVQWAYQFSQLLPGVDLVITSEPYGDYVAEYMGISHRSFDRARSAHPVSSTMIRSAPQQHWSYMPRSVKQYLQRSVTISGAESTGKSILAERVAKLYKAELVEEAGRRIIKNSNRYSIADLRQIAEEHAQAISVAKKSLAPLVIIDTDIYITQSYAHFAFGKYLDFPEEVYEVNSPDLRIYLDSNMPFIQDGTRMPALNQDALNRSHLKTLNAFNQKYTSITGSTWDEREYEAHVQIDRCAQIAS